MKIDSEPSCFVCYLFSVTNTPLLVAVAVIGVLCIVGMSYMVFQQKRSKYSQHVTVPSEEEMWEVSRHSEGFFILQLTRVKCEWKACNWSRQFPVSLMMYRLLRTINMQNKYFDDTEKLCCWFEGTVDFNNSKKGVEPRGMMHRPWPRRISLANLVVRVVIVNKLFASVTCLY